MTAARWLVDKSALWRANRDSVADPLIAATAEVEELTVLHNDADFELIADVTGQPVEWVVTRAASDDLRRREAGRRLVRALENLD